MRNMIILVNKQSIIHDIFERYLVLKHNAIKKKKIKNNCIYLYDYIMSIGIF